MAAINSLQHRTPYKQPSIQSCFVVLPKLGFLALVCTRQASGKSTTSVAVVHYGTVGKPVVHRGRVVLTFAAGQAIKPATSIRALVQLCACRHLTLLCTHPVAQAYQAAALPGQCLHHCVLCRHAERAGDGAGVPLVHA
jgi:hypothetical protein